MKRMHVHLGVADIAASVAFYTDLFGQQPTKQERDYAKWMVEDPRLNFAISTRSSSKGLDHFGIQVEDPSELSEVTERLEKADRTLFDRGETECCYAKSNKAWVSDPAGIAWEVYENKGDIKVFSSSDENSSGACCVPSSTSKSEASCC